MKISRLLETTPKWQHTNAKTRLKSLSSGDLAPEILVQLAKTDPDLEVRLVSIRQIRNPVALLDLVVLPEVGESATTQWVKVVGSNLAYFDQVNEELANELLVQLVNHAEKLDVKCKAASLVDATYLETILSNPNHTKVHQLSANRLCSLADDDEDQLERIHRYHLGKDKNVARIVKGKLQQIKSRREHQYELETNLDHNLKVIEKLAGSEYADEFERRLSSVNDNWNNLIRDNPNAFTDELNQRFVAARGKCESIIDVVVKTRQKRKTDAEDIAHQLRKLAESLHVSVENIDTVEEILKEARRRWPDGMDLSPYYALSTPLQQIYDQYASWHELEEKLPTLQADQQARQLSHIHWPEAFPLPDSLVAARIQVQNQQLEKTRAENSRQEKLAAIEKHLAHLETAISEGQIKAANRALTALNHLNENVAAPKRSLNRIHELTTKLSELRDWQGYATDPKREELCNSMERLATDPGILPPEKAKAIKELQTQWKKLGSSDSRSAQRMWARFKKQGDLAYEPCAQYFAEQRNVREANLAEKKKICDFLEVFIQENDWEHTDWKKANAVIKKAKDEWRKYDDIPGSKRKKIYGRFSEIIDALQAKQNAEYQRNHHLKSGLIADMKKIVTADMPVKQKVEKTKAVQVQWKTIGITDRRDDQKLWKEFRVECDRIFSEREQRVEAEKQKNTEFLAQVKNTVSAFADFLESDEPIYQSHIHKFKKSLEGFSLSSDHTSMGESKRLIKKASGLIKQQARASSQQMMTELIRRAELCSQYEAGSIDTAALDAAWQGDVELDKPLLEKITARRQGTMGNDPKEAEQLCIRLEILLGIDSPPESATARMAYQVERLNRELSQGIKETRTTAEQIRDIQITWHCLPVKIVDEKLKIRFNQAEAKLGAG